MRVRKDLTPFRGRLAALLVGLEIVLALIGLRLGQLQAIHGSHWRALAESNRQRRIPLLPLRGRLYDRSGRLLAGNEPAFQLLLFAAETSRPERSFAFLARLGVAPLAELRQRARARVGGPDAPRVLAPDLTWEQVCSIRSHQSDFPELAVTSAFRRVYPDGRTAAHAVGYVRLPNDQDLEEQPDLVPGVLVGASGVERRENSRLLGIPGEKIIVVDARGRELGTVRTTPAQDGADLTLTLDLGLQRIAASKLGDNSGAVVAIDPRSGAVRVLYSAPTFDSNSFAHGLTSEEWASLRDDPAHPLENRPLRGQYPPGSTIKPFLALTGLEANVIARTERVWCSGSINLYGHEFHCWARWGHGSVGLVRSLEVSCDIFYYRLGQKLGIERIAPALRRWGFGEASGLDPQAERTGLVGTPDWSQRVRGRPWYPGTTISVSIGQGPLTTTPLQLATAYAALANGGRLLRPNMIAGGGAIVRRDLELDPASLEAVCKGLREVVAGPEGTARRLAPLPVAGKTGTAQVIRLREGVDMEEVERKFRHHAWFVGWAPARDPQLVVAVLVEHGGGGASTAAPIAAAVLREALAGGAAGNPG